MTAGRPTLSHQGRTTGLSPGETLIGSGAECAIRIEGQGVAPVHAALTVEGRRVLLEDRSPDQETRVNDQRVSVVEVTSGTQVKFGEVEFQVQREGRDVELRGAAGTFSLATGENKVGRAPDCRVQIEDASISRYHATILVLPKKILCKDLQSTNGSTVAGRPVGVVELSPGDRIKLGDVETTFSSEAAAEPVMFELVVDGGSQILSPGELKIGRAPDCKISFSDDAGVSRYHAQITVGADTVRLRDLGSSNGTFVNGSQIGGEVALANGDRVGIGAHELVLRSKASVDPLGKTVMASDLGGLVDKTVLMPKGAAAAAPGLPTTGPWAVLDLSQGADEEQIRKRYQELFSDYQVRITNAPTPKLKEKYNQKLLELREAFAELVPDAAGAAANDLPSPVPVDAPEPPPPAPPTPAAPGSPAADAAAPVAAAPATAEATPANAIEPEATTEKAKQPLPKSAFVMAGLGVAAVGLAVVMTMLLFGAKKTEASLAATLEEKQQSIVRMEQEILDTQQSLETLQTGKAMLLENKPFKVCNLSTQGELRILWLAAAYIGAEDQLASFDSASVGYPRWTLNPGGSQKFDMVRDDRVIWDGSALFFSLLFKHRGVEYFRSGAMHNVPDDCYKLALDDVQ